MHTVYERLLLLLFLVDSDVEELERVAVLSSSNDTDPVPESVLLQELFGQVLEVTFRQRDTRSNGDFVVGAVPLDLHIFTKLASLSVDLYAIVQELFEVGTIEDLVSSRFGIVDNEFVLSSNFSGSSFGLQEQKTKTKT